MYCNFFGLRCRPFEDRADTQFFLATGVCEETLASMEYEAHYGTGMALVLGEAGTGKTLLIRALLSRLQASDHVVVLTWPSTGKMDLLRETAKGFGVSLPPSEQHARCLERLRRYLTRSQSAQRRCILIVDQGENLTAENVAQLATLVELQHDGGKLLSVTLVGQPHIRAFLDRPEFARISQLSYGERTVPPLTRKETTSYVRHRLRTAGAGNADLFSAAAEALIHEASRGIPRLINRMCNAAMLAAYGAGESHISTEIVAEVTHTTRPRERSVDAREVGVATAGQVAAGMSAATGTCIPGGVLVRGSGAGTKDLSAEVVSASAPAFGGAETYRPGILETIGDHAAGSGLSMTPADPVESMQPGGEELLRRLEGTLARADRINATTEASLAQFAAVEKHLTSLTGSAESLMGGLAEAIQRASGSLDNAERRLEEMVGRCEDRMRMIEAELSTTAEKSTDVRDQAQRVERACEQADQTESRLRSFAESLADKADEVQKRVALLMKGLGTAKETSDKLEYIRGQASSIVNDAGEKISSLYARVQETINHGERCLQRTTDSALERYRAKAEAQIRQSEHSSLERIEAAEHKLDTVLAEAASVSEAADKNVQRLRTALEETRTESKQLKADLMRDALRGVREELQEQLDQCEQSGNKTIQAVQRELDNIDSKVTTLTANTDQNIQRLQTALEETRTESKQLQADVARDALHEVREEMREQLDQCEQRGNKTIQAVQRELDNIDGKVATLTANADQNIQRLQTALEETRTESKQLKADIARDALCEVREEMHEQLARCKASGDKTIEVVQHRLDEVGNKADQLGQEIGTLKSRRDDLHSSVGTLSKALARATTKAAGLSETVRSAETSFDQLGRRSETLATNLSSSVKRGEELLPHVQTTCGQVEATQRSVTTTLLDIGAACERVGTLSEQAIQCEKLAERLSIGHIEAQKSTERIESAVASAGAAFEAVQQGAANAAEQCDRFESQRASAGQVLETLTEATTTGRCIIEQVSESARRAEETADAADEQTTRLTAIQAANHESTRQLEEVVSSSHQIHEALQGLVSHADEKLGRLNSHNAAATSVLRNLSAVTVTGQDIIERVNKSNHDMAQTADDAQERFDGLIETYEQLKLEIGTAADRLKAQLTAAQQSVEAGEPLLNDFIKQTRAIENQLGNLADRAARFEKQLGVATAGSGETVATVQAQAVRLEKVCSALRKVFGGLSQASLDARKQSAECARASDDATQRLATLTAETKRAAATLQEWVEEALHAQSRLERTLESCPSIRETHPGAALGRMSFPDGSAAEPLPTAGASGGLELLREPGNTDTAGTTSGATPPTTRAEEVARLIEDAKQAVGSTAG
jgi:general secretion pathway protein A